MGSNQIPTYKQLNETPASKICRPGAKRNDLLSGSFSDNLSYPRVTIVTPSYNQAQFLEETIHSVLSQGYPNLEYIIIDGGSIDGSVEIIRRYESQLAYWVSEKDGGQSEAINKGFHRASGEILAWLNSDDRYLPCAIHSAVRYLQDSKAALVYGRCNLVDIHGKVLASFAPTQPVTLKSQVFVWKTDYPSLPQPAVFFRREILERVGYLDESLHYTMDHDLWLRTLKYYPFHFVDEIWANYLVHPQSKTGRGWKPFAIEFYRVGRRYWRSLSLADGIYFRLFGKGLIFARRYVDDAFNAYHDRIWSDVLRNSFNAVALNPAWMFDRGLLSINLKALRNYCHR